MKPITQKDLQDLTALLSEFTERFTHMNDKGRMDVQTQYETIRTLTHALAVIGATAYKKECRADTSEAEKIGQALSHGGYNSLEIAKIAYEAWEDMNAHDANRWHNTYWKLYGGYNDDMETVSRVVNQGLVVKRYNEQTQEWEKHVMYGNVEWQESEETK